MPSVRELYHLDPLAVDLVVEDYVLDCEMVQSDSVIEGQSDGVPVRVEVTRNQRGVDVVG